MTRVDHPGSVRIFRDLRSFQEARAQDTRSWGFVPTMGALHAGHASLIQRSHAENDRTLVSVFVNPAQFNDPVDLESYPRTLEQDLMLIEASGGTDVLIPEASEVYADQYRYRISESQLSKTLCGAHRPGHFDGMLTVVLKLLLLARAHRAYFGEKDFQQLKLVEGMVEAFFIPTKIVPCPSVREADGLAMSSRNRRLSSPARARARHFPQLLQRPESPARIRQELLDLGFEVDYIEERLGRRLGAVRLEGVRLIDNFPLPRSETLMKGGAGDLDA